MKQPILILEFKNVWIKTYGSSIKINQFFYNSLILSILKLIICKKNTLVNAWPQANEFRDKYFTNITVFWVAPEIDNWDVEFM